MKILLTNDDGIFAEGINVLLDSVKDFGEIIVVAPDEERSGSSHGLTFNKPLRIREHLLMDGKIKGYAVNGTPVDCMKIALDYLINEPPDLLISGINNGPNLGTDILYSGTVSAAMEGKIYGIPSIAISLAQNKPLYYNTAGKFINKYFYSLYNAINQDKSLLNINIPDKPYNEIKGIKYTTMGKKRYENNYDVREDPRGKKYFWLTGEVMKLKNSLNSDVEVVKNNYISITPLSYDLTDNESLKKYNSNEIFD